MTASAVERPTWSSIEKLFTANLLKIISSTWPIRDAMFSAVYLSHFAATTAFLAMCRESQVVRISQPAPEWKMQSKQITKENTRNKNGRYVFRPSGKRNVDALHWIIK